MIPDDEDEFGDWSSSGKLVVVPLLIILLVSGVVPTELMGRLESVLTVVATTPSIEFIVDTAVREGVISLPGNVWFSNNDVENVLVPVVNEV